MFAALLLGLQMQKPAFVDDIQKFVDADKKAPPAKGQTLFIGSSSFTNWKDAQAYFPKHKILNRAFGGSTLLDVLGYQHQVIFPYDPSQVVIYCGENDLAAGDQTLPAYAVLDRFTKLFGVIRAKYPSVPIAYVAMKPSPSRWHLRAKYMAGNKWIAEFLAGQRNTDFIDVWPVMLGPDGRPKPGIFVADQLHMNAEGYKLWAPLIERVLR